MEKRSNVSRDGGIRIDKHDFDSEIIEVKVEPSKVKKEENLTVSERIWIRNMYPAKVGVVGPSGEKYVFAKRGAEVKVRRIDVETLLAKRRGGCCGTAPGRMFVLV